MGPSEKRLLLRAHVGELCSRALSIYDNDLGTTGIGDPREKATSFVRLAHMLEEQVCAGLAVTYQQIRVGMPL